MGELRGSVFAGLDKDRAARQGSNEGGHAMRYCFHLLPYHMGADSPFTLRGPYVGGLGCWVCFHCSSVFFHNKANKTQVQEMESGLFDA